MERLHGKDFVLTDYAKNLIRFKARQLARRRDFQSEDLEDLQQHLWLALIKAADQFDPAKASLDTYIDRVVNRASAMLVRARSCPRRGHGHRIDSLDYQKTPGGESSEPLAVSISVADLARRTGVESRNGAIHCEDAEAFEHALTQMSPEMRDQCRRVMGGSVASSARAQGISRRQVRKTLESVRPLFEESGFVF